MDPDQALVLRRAFLAQQRGQLDEAERLVRSVLEKEADSVPALSMLVALLKGKGDLVGSVAAAQRVSEIALESKPLPGAVARAREDRARIENQVVRDVVGPLTRYDTPLSAFTMPERGPARSRRAYLTLVVLGVLSLFLVIAAVLRGQWWGYLWFAVSFVAAGWCYQDAETRGLAGLSWAPLVLCLGPFGLAFYLLATR